jgi:hypothetical protein
MNLKQSGVSVFQALDRNRTQVVYKPNFFQQSRFAGILRADDFVTQSASGRDMRILHDIMRQEMSVGPRFSVKLSIANEPTVFKAMIR